MFSKQTGPGATLLLVTLVILNLLALTTILGCGESPDDQDGSSTTRRSSHHQTPEPTTFVLIAMAAVSGGLWWFIRQRTKR